MKCGNYEFELRVFHYLESRSEETYCFDATLYVNGRKFAACGNGGYGAATDVTIFPACDDFGEEVEAFLRTQPKIKCAYSDIELDFDLEYIVDTLVEELLEKRELKKIMAKTDRCLVFRHPDGNYGMYRYKILITEILETARGSVQIRRLIAEETAKGNRLVNENIPENLLTELDIKH